MECDHHQHAVKKVYLTIPNANLFEQVWNIVKDDTGLYGLPDYSTNNGGIAMGSSVTSSSPSAIVSHHRPPGQLWHCCPSALPAAALPSLSTMVLTLQPA